MKTYIVVQGKPWNAVDWSTIYSLKEYRLIAITLPRISDIWDVTQRVYFERIYTVESINDEVLRDIVSKIRKSFGFEGDTEEVIDIYREKTKMKARLIESGLGHFLPRFKTFDPAEVTEDHI